MENKSTIALAGGSDPIHLGAEASMPDLSMIVDVVDQSNKPITTARRGDLFSAKQNFRTVHVLLRDEFNLFLLQRLPLHHARSPGLLGSSAAGYVKAGESYSDAAKRKLQTELGLHTPLANVGEFVMTDESSEKFVSIFAGHNHVRPVFDPTEIADLRYLKASDIHGMMAATPEAFTMTFRHLYEASSDLFV